MIVAKPVRILGIESSCDETAAAVVENGTTVLSAVVASQLDTHGKYGGVVPELASREHLRAIVPVVRAAMEQAGCGFEGLSAIAATSGPGLVGSLLVGLTYAKSLCMARGLPLIGVNHIEGHIHAVVMEAKQAGKRSSFRRWPWLSAVGTPTSSKFSKAFITGCSARHGMTPRARPSIKSASYSGSVIQAGRWSICSRPTEIQEPCASPSQR